MMVLLARSHLMFYSWPTYWCALVDCGCGLRSRAFLGYNRQVRGGAPTLPHQMQVLDIVIT
jgi:hypothetical protein